MYTYTYMYMFNVYETPPMTHVSEISFPYSLALEDVNISFFLSRVSMLVCTQVALPFHTIITTNVQMGPSPPR